MSEPLPVVRAVTYERDRERCVSCGARTGLQYQHRQATGMGGSKVRPRLDEGVTSCARCNPAYEGHLQAKALKYGWKVKRNIHPKLRCEDVPVFSMWEQAWFVLAPTGGRYRISEAKALERMHLVYGIEYDEMVRAAA